MKAHAECGHCRGTGLAGGLRGPCAQGSRGGHHPTSDNRTALPHLAAQAGQARRCPPPAAAPRLVWNLVAAPFRKLLSLGGGIHPEIWAHSGALRPAGISKTTLGWSLGVRARTLRALQQRARCPCRMVCDQDRTYSPWLRTHNATVNSGGHIYPKPGPLISPGWPS